MEGCKRQIGQLKRFGRPLLLSAVCACALFSAQPRPERTVSLTQEEQQWLAGHDGEIRVGITVLPPQVIHSMGHYSGLSIDYLQLLERKLGCRFRLVPHETWNDVILSARSRGIDMIFAAQHTPERLGYLAFTEPYIELPNMILVRKDRPGASTLNDMKGWKVAVSTGSAVQEFLKAGHPGLSLHPVPDELTGLMKVSVGEVDAMVVEMSRASYYLEKAGILNLRIAGDAGFIYRLRFAVRSDWPILRGILDKGLASITADERRRITNKWVSTSPQSIFARKAFWIPAAAALAVILAIVLWNRSLQRLVRQRTAQIEAEVAERRRAEEQVRDLNTHLEQRVSERTADLARTNDQLQAILETATSAIVLSRNRTIVRCNRMLDEIFGYAPGELVGQNTRIWYPDDASYESFGEGIAMCAARGDIFLRELQAVRKDGSLFWCRMKVKAKDMSDLTMEVVGVIEDITAERQREEVLTLALEAAERADRIKSAFLATMSHELRTPLNSIIGFTGILLQGLAGPLSPEQKKQLGMVRDSANHLLELINDVLDISKIEAGQLEVMSETFDLRESLEKAVNLVRPLAEKRGITLELQIAPQVGTLASDRRRVEQILMNLISNAIKFTERGGVRITCSETGREVEIRVQDTGIGIRPEDIDALFHPFRQLDSGTTRKYEGTGLGLSICKRLLDLLGGWIRVESALGEGSTFIFALPLKERKP